MTQPRKSLTLKDWPDTDRQCWLTACEKADWFENVGRAANWSPASQYDARYAYGIWLRFLSDHDPAVLTEAIHDRVSPVRIETLTRQLQKRVRSSTVAIYLDHLVMALRALSPDQDWQYLTALVRRLKHGIKPKAKQHRMVDIGRLYQLGIDLMGSGDPAQPLEYRDGLMIALLAACPLRRRTFSLIKIDEQLHFNGTAYWLSFRPGEIKNKRPFECPLPDDLTAYVTYYLDTIRPIFPGAHDHQGLWCSMKGQPMPADSIYKVICKRTAAKFGVPINPHLFRDCAATSLATHAPESVLAGVEILGHADTRALHTHYIHAQTQVAGKAYQMQIELLRQTLSVSKKRKRQAI